MLRLSVQAERSIVYPQSGDKKKIARGEYIYRRGEKIDELYALRSGAAKVYDARGQLMGIVLPDR